MSGTHLASVLLFLSALALGATPYLGSPWPGVALCGLALVPWGLGEWMARKRTTADDKFARLVDATTAIAEKMVTAESRIEEQGQQISSLRSAVSVRGTLGG